MAGKSYEYRTRMNLDRALALLQDSPRDETRHVLRNFDSEDTFSVMYHPFQDWCDYCVDDQFGVRIHNAKPDPYENQITKDLPRVKGQDESD